MLRNPSLYIAILLGRSPIGPSDPMPHGLRTIGIDPEPMYAVGSKDAQQFALSMFSHNFSELHFLNLDASSHTENLHLCRLRGNMEIQAQTGNG